MKALLTLVLVLGIGMVASADHNYKGRPTAKSSWEEIYHSGLWPVFPKEQFGNTFVPVYSTCIAGGMLHAKINQCVEYKNGGEGGADCVRYSEVDAVKPMSVTETYCAETKGEGGCGRWETYTRAIRTSYEINVVSSTGEGVERVEFTKHFDIPACN